MCRLPGTCGDVKICLSRFVGPRKGEDPLPAVPRRIGSHEVERRVRSMGAVVVPVTTQGSTADRKSVV